MRVDIRGNISLDTVVYVNDKAPTFAVKSVDLLRVSTAQGRRLALTLELALEGTTAAADVVVDGDTVGAAAVVVVAVLLLLAVLVVVFVCTVGTAQGQLFVLVIPLSAVPLYVPPAACVDNGPLAELLSNGLPGPDASPNP